MRFPIDAVFLDTDFRVVKLVQRLAPWRAASARRAKAVLELPAGECARRGLELDDRLVVLEHAVESPAAARTRVLLVAPDRRFRAVASALLRRRGCSVTTHDDLLEVAELATRTGAEVVVIDATPSLTATAHAAAKLQRLRPPVAIVAVANEPHERLSALPVLPKWGSFDALYAAIEQAREGAR
jgi:CheY-like chemotaxis protein